MSCSNIITLKGLGMNCDANIGGIKRAWFGPRDYFTVEPVSGSTENGTGYADLARAESAPTGATLSLYEFAKETGSLTTTQVVNEQNGSNYFQNLVTLVFNRMEGWKHMEISALAVSQMIGVIEDLNGNKWIVGDSTYLSSIGSEIATTGTANDDRNGYSLSLQENASHLPYELLNDNGLLPSSAPADSQDPVRD